MLSLLLGLLLQAIPPSLAPATAVPHLTLSPPNLLAEIDTSKVGGDPVALALSADGTIYLRVRRGKEIRHYLITPRPSLSVGQVDDTPGWAQIYLEWKSALAAPGDPALRIEVEQGTEQRTTRSGTTELAGSSGGAMDTTKGGQGDIQAGAIDRANAAAVMRTVTLRFKGHVVGEWVNEPPQPGMRLGWAPPPMGVVAYVDDRGRLVLVDGVGQSVRVPDVAHALLPAWSADGRQILCLQKKSRTAYLLTATAVQ